MDTVGSGYPSMVSMYPRPQYRHYSYANAATAPYSALYPSPYGQYQLPLSTKPSPFFPMAASTYSYPSYSQPYAMPHRSRPYYPASYVTKRPLSESTHQMIAKYAPRPKAYMYPKYVVKPYPVASPFYTYPTSHRRRRPVVAAPEPPAPTTEKFEYHEGKGTSETKQQEVKSKPEKEESYVEIGGIGYKGILNSLTSTLSNIGMKIGTEENDEGSNTNSSSESNSASSTPKTHKVRFKVGTSRKPSPFIQIGQSRVTFQQDGRGGVTITLSKNAES